MRQTLALFRPKSGNKATPYHWVRFSYRGHVYRHSTFTRNEAAARRRGEVWRQRVIEFVDRTGRVPREAEAPMPTAPEETPEVVTIVPDDRGAVTIHVGAGTARLTALLAELERAIRSGSDRETLLAHLSGLRQLLAPPSPDGAANRR
jgi:hypothetical protein